MSSSVLTQELDQGVLSAIIALAIDWVLSNGNGVKWGSGELNDLDFANDIALLSMMWNRTTGLTSEVEQ